MQFHQYYFFFAVLQPVEICRACLPRANSRLSCLGAAGRRGNRSWFSAGGWCGGDAGRREVQRGDPGHSLQPAPGAGAGVCSAAGSMAQPHGSRRLTPCLPYSCALLCAIAFTWKVSLSFMAKLPYFVVFTRAKVYSRVFTTSIMLQKRYFSILW